MNDDAIIDALVRAVERSVNYIDPGPKKAQLHYRNTDGSLKTDDLIKHLTVKHAARAASAPGDERTLDDFNDLDESERRRLVTAAVNKANGTV